MTAERDPYWDYEENECANCNGEGFTYGCSWDWQCDTYDEGEGTCLCTRSCDWCRPSKPDAQLQRVLSEALARDTDQSPKGGNAEGGAVRSTRAGAEGIAQGPVS